MKARSLIMPPPCRSSVRVSLGVASTQARAALTPLELIRQADERHDRAKREGRNRVVF